MSWEVATVEPGHRRNWKIPSSSTMAISLNRRKHVLFLSKNWSEQIWLSRKCRRTMVKQSLNWPVTNVKKSSYSWNAIWKSWKPPSNLVSMKINRSGLTGGDATNWMPLKTEKLCQITRFSAVEMPLQSMNTMPKWFTQTAGVLLSAFRSLLLLKN